MEKLLILIIICISSVSYGQVPSYVPTDNIVAWWGFNGNTNDESGNGNNGVNNGALLTSDRFGNENSAYDFDGLNDRIEVMPIDFPERTLSVWFKGGDNIVNARMFDCDYPTLQNGATQIVVRPDVIDTWLGNGQPNDLVRCFEPYQQNNWYNVTLVKTAQKAETFINGTLICSFPSENISSTANQVPAITNIGCSRLLNRFFKGIIDDIGIWERALDSCEIKDLYEGSLGNCCTPDPITSQPTDITVPLNGIGMFSTTTSITSPTYQWQMNDGTGYTDLFNAGQFSGVDTDMLTVSNVTLGQNNTLFRCIVSENSDCSDTTDVAILTVQDNTGLEDLNKDLFNVYPNPTTNSFTISSEKVINSEFKLIDAQGREVLTGSMNGQEHTIDISKLSNGVYSVVFNNTEYPVVSVIKE